MTAKLCRGHKIVKLFIMQFSQASSPSLVSSGFQTPAGYVCPLTWHLYGQCIVWNEKSVIRVTWAEGVGTTYKLTRKLSSTRNTISQVSRHYAESTASFQEAGNPIHPVLCPLFTSSLLGKFAEMVTICARNLHSFYCRIKQFAASIGEARN